MRTAILFFVLIASYAGYAADDAQWPFPGLTHRRHYVVEPRDGVPHQTAQVVFGTGNVLDAGEPDIRVVAGGNSVPWRVMQVGPGSTCRLAFKVVPPAGDYYVYYGPKAAVRKPPQWKPEAGLILQTRRLNSGDFNDYKQFMKVIDNSGPPFGTGIVSRVFHGHNPFGMSDTYVSVYEGFLWIEKGGAYTFATTSDDASVMRVDGKIVATKYGRGGAPRNVRFMGKPVQLLPGRHAFEYYHIEGGGEQAAVAAWKPPGGNWGVIPPEAFGPVIDAQPARYEVQGQAVAPDIRPINFGEVIFRGKQMTRFSFKNATLDPEIFQFRPRWDFGDGALSETVNPEHVYFEFGEYDVTLTLSRAGKSYTAQHRIIVDEGWQRQTIHNPDNLRQYYRIIKGYQFERMKVSDIDRAMDVFEEIGAHDEIVRVSGVVVARADEADDPTYLRHCLLHAQALCSEKERRDKEPPEEYVDDGTKDEFAGVDFFATAVDVLAKAEDRLEKDEDKVKAALKKADVYFYYVRRLDKAREEYERILKVYRNTESSETRAAQIRLGDYFRKRGRTDAAREAYEKANEMQAFGRPYTQEAVRRGALEESVENYLIRGELDAARRELDIWEWEHPEEKLVGRCSLLRAEIALKEENPTEALTQLHDLVTGNKDSPLAPEALLRAARLNAELKDYRKALAACDALIADYADSPLKEDAGYLSGEYLLNIGKHEKALARLQEMTATYPDSSSQPRAMLLAGDCLLKLGRPAKARSAWQDLVERFPDTDESKAAEERMKK